MTEPKIVTVDGAARLARGGLFVRGQLIGVTEHGAAVYAYDRTIIVRPAGIRPDDVKTLRSRTQY